MVIHIFAVADEGWSFVPRDYSRLRTEKRETRQDGWGRVTQGQRREERRQGRLRQ